MAVVGAQCLRWGTVSPGAVITFARRVIVDGAGGLRRGWQLLFLALLPIGGSPGQSQENHMVTTTVWTHSRRLWRKGWVQSL